MGTELRHRLLKELETPPSFDEWLLGTQYSQKYFNSLRLKTQARPVPNSSAENPKSVRPVKEKAACKTQLPAVSQETKTSASDGQTVEKPEVPSPGNTVKGKRELQPGTGSTASSTKCKKGALLKTSGTTLSNPNNPTEEEIVTRDLLWESYHRAKDTYTGVFPALLTPYQRPFWSYKVVNDQTEKSVLSENNTQQKGHLPQGTFSSASPYSVFDIPNEEKPIMTRRHFPNGPPCFAPTPCSSKWLQSMR